MAMIVRITLMMRSDSLEPPGETLVNVRFAMSRTKMSDA